MKYSSLTCGVMVLSVFSVLSCGSALLPTGQMLSTDTPAQHILIYSDAGFADKAEDDLVAAIMKRHQLEKFDFGISAGDNIQASMLSSDTIEETFEIPFRPLIQARVRVYATLGNHDHMRGRLDKELAYSAKVDAERKNTGGFVMPDRDFVVTKPDLKILFLDVAESDGSVVWSGVRAAYAEKQLCNRTERWAAVVMHYPMWSTGGHGDTTGLHKTLLPILKRCPVDFVISGHDHQAELFRVEGIRYMVVGNGARPRAGVETSAQKSVFRMNDQGFADLTITGNQATARYFDISGAVRFEESVTKSSQTVGK